MGKEITYRDLPTGAQVAIATSALVGVSLMAGAIVAYDWTEYWSFLAMLGLALLSANTRVRLLGGSSLSLLTWVVLLSVVILSPYAPVIIGVCGVLAQTALPSRTLVSYTVAFNLGMISVTVGLAELGYRTANFGGSSGTLVGLMVASLLYYLGNSVLVSIIVALSTRKSAYRMWHDNFLFTAPSFFVAGVLAFAAYEIMQAVHFGVLIVLAPILYFTYYSYRVYLENLEGEKKHAEEMARLHQSTLETLVLAIDAKDRNQGHVIRVKKYSRALAKAMRLEDSEVEGIAAAALLHDIGKLAIPDYILRKRGALSAEEMSKMRLHPEIGAKIISNINFPYPVAAAIRHHHERFDGSGYPDRLKGHDIPVAARLLAIVDTFESFVSRDEGAPTILEDGMALLESESGKLFDPEIVEAWKEIYREVAAPETLREGDGPVSRPYTDIERATLEANLLDNLAESTNRLGSVCEIAALATAMLEEQIPGSDVVYWTMTGGRLEACNEQVDGKPLTLDMGSGVAGWVAAEQSPCVNMVASFGYFKGCRVVAAPLVFDGIVVGVLAAYSRTERFSDDDVRLVTATAERIAGDVHSARELEAANRAAISDRLTGLANRRALEKAFEGKSGPFSVVLIDVNAFKSVNDTFGHQAGDDVLVGLANHLRATFADPSGLVCRLGGDEFLVASSRSPFEIRREIRAFRKAVADDPAFAPYREFGFGVSWGVASAPDDGANLSEVTAVADRRMYSFKTRIKRDRSRLMANV